MKCLREKGQGPRIDQYFLRSQSSQSNEIQRQEANHSSQDISTPVIDVRRTCMDTVSDEPNDPCEPGLERYSSLGETVTLPCAGFQEYEDSLIHWTFRPETASELALGGKITVKQTERAARLEVLPDSSLRIHHLHTEDAGQYEWQQYVNGMFNKGGTPVVLTLLTSLERYSSLGETVTLPCAGFQEYEDSLIHWTFRPETASELALGGKITVKQTERAARLEVLPDSSLRIHHLHTEDAGQYEWQQYVNGMFNKGGTPVVLTLLTTLLLPPPRARYTLPCQPQVCPGLAHHATVPRVRAGVPASTSDTNVAKQLNAGRRITQS
ncbi:UNVERIFIED_CONTAM: hypothetical protein FKN15_005021 [Acipenser sinensis]